MDAQGVPRATGDATPDGYATSGTFASELGSKFTIPCTIVHTGDLTATQEAIRQCVLEHPEINLAYTSDDVLAQAAGDGMRHAGKTIGVDVTMLTTGADKAGLDLAQGTWIDALARPSYWQLGSDAIGALNELHQGQAPQPSTNLDYRNTGLTLCSDDLYTSVFVTIPVAIPQCWDEFAKGR